MLTLDANIAKHHVGAAGDLQSRAAAVAAIAAEHAEAVDRDSRFPAEAVAALRAQRLMGLLVPRAFPMSSIFVFASDVPVPRRR